MIEPLNQSEESASQTRNISGGGGRSLLDRIKSQHQQQKQQQPNQEQHQQPGGIVDNHANFTAETSSHQYQVPQYSSELQRGNGTPGAGDNTTSNNSWTNFNFTSSNNVTMMTTQNENGNHLNDSLLTPTSGDDSYYYNGSGEYSSSQYFMTFVMDIYRLFNWLPLPVRWVVIILLLFIAWKLL
jgi:hypothetical protein